MSLSLDIRLKKASNTYKEGELVSGFVVIHSKGECAHQGISLTAEGIVNLQLSSKSVGVFEAFYNSVKPIPLFSYALEIQKAGKFPNGKTEIPFEIPLRAKAGTKLLYETYHGVFINIQYLIKVDMKRGILSKDVHKECEFIVKYRAEDVEKAVAKPVDFCITPNSLEKTQDKLSVPKFKVTGRLASTVCCITEPLSGEVIVESSEVPIKSIELQLIRVEVCGCAEGFARDATEIQNIQIAEGDVCHGVPIPMHMIFPRLFTCPTLHTNNFKIDFEVNLLIVFYDERVVTENFPIKLLSY